MSSSFCSPVLLIRSRDKKQKPEKEEESPPIFASGQLHSKQYHASIKLQIGHWRLTFEWRSSESSRKRQLPISNESNGVHVPVLEQKRFLGELL